MLDKPVSRPAQSYAEACERLEALRARDGAEIANNAHSYALLHDGQTEEVVVLLHGFTNHPGQFVRFAPMVHNTGANVVVPRMPLHGYADRMTDALRDLTAEAMLETANEALDIACGLGKRVKVLGISLGATLCAWAAQYRSDIALSVPVSPMFAVLQCPDNLNRMVFWCIKHLPNFFMWWDPRIKTAQRPRTAYPRFSTHALWQVMRIGDDVHATADARAPLAERIVTVVNRADPAVNNAVTREVVQSWKAARGSAIVYDELGMLPENHDIIDPDNPLARIDLVYPRLLDALALKTP